MPAPLGRQLSDFYHFPHVQLFDSWSELLHMLQTVDLQGVSISALDTRVRLQGAGSGFAALDTLSTGEVGLAEVFDSVMQERFS